MNKLTGPSTLLSLVALMFAGCGQQTTTPAGSAVNTNRPAVDGAKFLLASEPAGAQSVIEAREKGQDNAEIVVVGRIGGSENPWIENRAAFSIVDGTLKACSDIEGDNCPTPWDYCCETDKLPNATALVKIVDGSGDVVAVDARELLKVKELETVVVKGKAKRDEAGNLTVLADSIYVKK